MSDMEQQTIQPKKPSITDWARSLIGKPSQPVANEAVEAYASNDYQHEDDYDSTDITSKMYGGSSVPVSQDVASPWSYSGNMDMIGQQAFNPPVPDQSNAVTRSQTVPSKKMKSSIVPSPIQRNTTSTTSSSTISKSSLLQQPLISPSPYGNISTKSPTVKPKKSDLFEQMNSIDTRSTSSGTTMTTTSSSSSSDWGMLDHEIPLADLTVENKLGEGFFGVVYSGKWNGETVAIKRLKQGLKLEEIENFKKESSTLSRLRHANITLFYGVTAPPSIALVTELLHSSLYSIIHTNATSGRLPLPLVLRIASDVAKGGAYLHTRKPAIIHRDLSSVNVLVTGDLQTISQVASSSSNAPIAKISDFGLSRQVEWYMTASVGNCFYLAPEVFTGAHYTEKADLYSFAIMLWEMMKRQAPFKDLAPQRAAFLVAVNGLRPDLTDPMFDDRLCRILRACWDSDCDKRPSFRQVNDDICSLMIGGSSAVQLNGQMDDHVYDALYENDVTDHSYDLMLNNNSSPSSVVSIASMKQIGSLLSSHLTSRPPIWQLVERGIIPPEFVTFSNVNKAVKDYEFRQADNNNNNNASVVNSNNNDRKKKKKVVPKKTEEVYESDSEGGTQDDNNNNDDDDDVMYFSDNESEPMMDELSITYNTKSKSSAVVASKKAMMANNRMSSSPTEASPIMTEASSTKKKGSTRRWK